MTRLIRVFGFLLIGVGTLVLASYLIEPLHALWPWLLQLPLPIRIGLVVAALGFLLLLGSILWERLEDRKQDHDLLED